MTLKALIIEDDYDAIRIMTTLLHHTEFETYAVSNGREAIDRLYELKPDIVLLDMHLPEISGLEILDLIRTSDDLRKTHVIAVSADREMLQKAAQRAENTLPKPIDILKLRGLLTIFRYKHQVP